MTAYERLCAARDQNRPTAIEYIRRMFGESFLELHGDRRYGDDKAVLAGIASLNGMPLTVIALEKGRNVKERVARNFGCPQPEGYRKSLRLMREAESNISMRIEELEDKSGVEVAGRGVLHLSVLMETMRREGFEFQV